ncbi:MAG: hypothetical protein FVQ81_10005 [Candidatus Glassbacteria bacterium]|nr:hypothetical protein [Candidatus Glassbacteria bacterium]
MTFKNGYEINLFVFSSKNLTNIWAGIGAKLWAVSQRKGGYKQAIITNSKNMKVGSLGLLYCSARKAFTTPFLVTSRPDCEKIVSDIWPEKWILPFGIYPLGSPNKVFTTTEAYDKLSLLKNVGNISHKIHFQPTTVFQPTKITETDWSIIFNSLFCE